MPEYVPPPAQGPVPPDPGDGPKTDPGLKMVLDRHEVEQLRRFKAELETLKQQMELNSSGGLAELKTQLSVRNMLAAGGVIVTVFLAGISFYGKAMAAAESAGRDAGTNVVKDIAREQKYQREDITRVEKQVKYVQDQLDLLLDKMKVPENKRPAPVPEPDGGVRR